jgi:hypothetical protein
MGKETPTMKVMLVDPCIDCPDVQFERNKPKCFIGCQKAIDYAKWCYRQTAEHEQRVRELFLEDGYHWDDYDPRDYEIKNLDGHGEYLKYVGPDDVDCPLNFNRKKGDTNE